MQNFIGVHVKSHLWTKFQEYREEIQMHREKVAKTHSVHYIVHVHVSMYCGFIHMYLHVYRCHSSFIYFPIEDDFSKMCSCMSI
jgi:hypothetical protein